MTESAYMIRAVDEVLAFGPSDAVVPDGLPVPQWSGDGLVEPTLPA